MISYKIDITTVKEMNMDHFSEKKCSYCHTPIYITSKNGCISIAQYLIEIQNVDIDIKKAIIN